jgi:hypothetical protein
VPLKVKSRLLQELYGLWGIHVFTGRRTRVLDLTKDSWMNSLDTELEIKLPS